MIQLFPATPDFRALSYLEKVAGLEAVLKTNSPAPSASLYYKRKGRPGQYNHEKGLKL